MQHHAGLSRQLVRRLNALRGSRRLSELATEMHCSGAKMTRMFQGGPMSWADLQMLLTILEADEMSRWPITQLWSQLRETSPALNRFRDVLSPAEIEYFEAVAAADTVRIQAGPVLPMMARHLDYQIAVRRSEMRTADVERWSHLLPLMNRQLNPDRQLHIIVCESALRRWTAPGFHPSLDLLLALYSDGAVIQIFPLAVSLRPGLMGGFSILGWDDDPEAMQYCVAWSHLPVDWVTQPEQRAKLEFCWRDLVAHCTSPQQLPAIIERAHRQSERDRDPLIA